MKRYPDFELRRSRRRSRWSAGQVRGPRTLPMRIG